jgi:hypothetical protein
MSVDVPVRSTELAPAPMAASRPAEGAVEFSPESVLTAVTVEEPLPLLVAEMSLWSIGASAVMVSLGFLAVVASPIIVAERHAQAWLRDSRG